MKGIIVISKQWYTFFILLWLLAYASLCEAGFSYPRFYLGLEGNWLKQSADGTAYANIDRSVAINHATIGTSQRVVHPYQLSGRLHMGYRIKPLLDVQFSALIHDHKKATPLLAAGLGEHIDPILPPINWQSRSASYADSTHRYRTYAFDLSMGYLFHHIPRVYMRPYLGISVADLRETQLTHYYDVQADVDIDQADVDTDLMTVYERACVLGIGPLAGVNLFYVLNRQWRLISDMSVSVLTGHIHMHYTATSKGNVLSLNDIESKTNRSIFERFSAKLALSYRFKIRQIDGQWQLGYRLDEYLNNKASLIILHTSVRSVLNHFFEDTGSSGPFFSLFIHV